MFARTLFSLVFTAALAGCYATVPVGEVGVTSAPILDIEAQPYVYYEGRPHYWYHGHWYYQDRGRWLYYRHEPNYLYRHRYYHRPYYRR